MRTAFTQHSYGKAEKLRKLSTLTPFFVSSLPVLFHFKRSDFLRSPRLTSPVHLSSCSGAQEGDRGPLSRVCCLSPQKAGAPSQSPHQLSVEALSGPVCRAPRGPQAQSPGSQPSLGMIKAGGHVPLIAHRSRFICPRVQVSAFLLHASDCVWSRGWWRQSQGGK